jgi:hypothetical protein
MYVAADLLNRAGKVVCVKVKQLTTPTAMTAFVSAFISVVKQAAVMTKAAGSAQGQGQQQQLPSNRQPAAAAVVATQCFPGAIPSLMLLPAGNHR